MIKNIKDYINNAFIYKVFIPYFLNSVISIGFGKILAVYMPIDQFGIYSIQFALFSLFNSIFLSPSVNTYKYYFSKYGDYQLNILLIRFISFISLLLFVVLFIFYKYNYFRLNLYSIVLILIYFILTWFYSLHIAKLNIHGKFKDVGLLPIMLNILQISILLIMIFVVNNNRSNTIWLSYVVSFFILLSLVLTSNNKFIVLEKVYGKINLLELLKYMTPLLLLGLFTSLNNYVDRYFIELFMTSRDVGMYSAIYNLASKTSLLAAPFIIYLNPIIYNNHADKNSLVDSKLKTILKIYVSLAALMCLIILLCRDIIGVIFLSKAYSSVFFLLPLLAIGFIFYNSIFIIETKMYGAGNTMYILLHNIFGALTNILLNYFLINEYGILGCAIATSISFMLQSFYCIYLYKRVII